MRAWCHTRMVMRSPLARIRSSRLVSRGSVDPRLGGIPLLPMNARIPSRQIRSLAPAPRFAAPVATLLSIAFAWMLSPVSAAADPWLLAPGDRYTSIGGSYFSADSYHGLDGGR